MAVLNYIASCYTHVTDAGVENGMATFCLDNGAEQRATAELTLSVIFDGTRFWVLGRGGWIS